MNIWRENFPVLHNTMNGKPLAYLDTASSAQKPAAVLQKMVEISETVYANIHRGLYYNSQVTTKEFERVREKVASFLNIPSTGTVVFTRNATEGINLVAQSWGRTFLKAGDEVVISEMEHHANIVPWQLLRDQVGIVLKTIKMTAEGRLDLVDLQAQLSARTRLVSLFHVSNALGVINPIYEIKNIIQSYDSNIKLMVDGSQAVVHGPVDLSAIDPDFYVLTGHKLYGPTGIGVLYGKTDLLNEMPPYQGGGDMIENVTFEKTTYKAAPYKFEAGTPAILEVIGLGEALDYLSTIGMENVAAHEAGLLRYATEQLREIEGLRIYADIEDKAGIISFTTDWGHASDIAMILDQCGVAVRTGHHCCMPLMRRLGVEGTVRVSFGLYNHKGDVEQLLEGLEKARTLLA